MEEDSNLLSSEQVRTVVFTTALRGYQFDDVDELLDSISETLHLYEREAELGPQHLTVRQVEEISPRVEMPGYDITEVNDFRDWALWTLRKYAAGHRRGGPIRRPRDSNRGVSPQDSSKPGDSAIPRATDKEPEPQTVPPPGGEMEPAEQRRPMTSGELVEQAKKWLNR